MSAELVEACEGLAIQISNSQFGGSRASLNAILPFQEVIKDPDEAKVSLPKSLAVLAGQLSTQLQRKDPWAIQVFSILAETTKSSVIWRQWFGVLQKPTARSNEAQSSGHVEPDCILEVARRLLQDSSSENRDEVRNAIRLIANCCADNNFNRALVVLRGGIKSMLDIIRDAREVDLVLPTLFNICVDFDEPALTTDNKPLTLPTQMGDTKAETADYPLNLAQQKLVQPREISTAVTTIELFLQLITECDDCRKPTLADLIEMATLPALFGVGHLFGCPEDTVPQDCLIRLIDAVLLNGSKLAGFDISCCVAMSQAMLNLMSQKPLQYLVLDSSIRMQHFVTFPYLVSDEEDEQNELLPLRTGFLKQVYLLSAMDEYSNNYKPTSPFISWCMSILHQACSNSNSLNAQPYACICVLLSNTITSTERADWIVTNYTIHVPLTKLLEIAQDKDILLPAINLATRLALASHGPETLYRENILATTQRFLAEKQMSLDIQRETVTLIRLLIKGRVEFLAATSQFRSLNIFQEVMKLYRQTIDGSTKLEVGRLVIEVCRTSFSSIRDSTPIAEIENTPFSILGCEDIGDPIAFIVKEGQSSALISEGWFGLAMLSTWPGCQTSVLKSLEAEDVMTILIETARSKQGPSYENIKLLLANASSLPAERIPGDIRDEIRRAAGIVGIEWPS